MYIYINVGKVTISSIRSVGSNYKKKWRNSGVLSIILLKLKALILT